MEKVASLQLLSAKVGHARLSPLKNVFEYKVFYVACPVQKEQVATPRFFSFNTFNILSIYTRDHGKRDSTLWYEWFVEECKKSSITVEKNERVLMLSHPRLFGYAFNPISYWLLIHPSKGLRAVLCEVNNTFGDNHNYLLSHSDGRSILPTDSFRAKKNLYVSPFNLVDPGEYAFTFSYSENSFKSVINYYQNGVHILNTFMGGSFSPLTTTSILKSVMSYPFMTLLVVFRIHWQALILKSKGLKDTLDKKPPHTGGLTTQGSHKE